jgi:Arc/MetJ-type ribon-helix-helix transcriptional regulator
MPKRNRISEPTPVQVYLAPDDRRRLERLADQFDLSKSDVLRRGLAALEREMMDPNAHPALRIIGIAADGPDEQGFDAGRDHDRFLADAEEASWRAGKKGPRGRRGS